MCKRKCLVEACIVDFLIDANLKSSENTLNELLKLIRVKIGPHAVTTVISQGHPFTHLLRRNGFRSIPSNVNFVVKPLSKVGNKCIDAQWALSGLDIDTF
jgi:hypothetical protein